mgnify:CR=1 FL=1
MNQQKQNGNIIAIITMFFLFAMISFVTNLAAPFGTIWKNQYAGANTLGMMGNDEFPRISVYGDSFR